ncbi:enolase [Chondrus crispus]|uniref:phosphopyruvate hydratase n=1 Tax=Chondrus crispus TaxID=2769 RepID=R7Q6Y6_CHOCR|nr:enolase [Chondrus crispus]CDF33583.1 enolase [Chondrus crispus]|eukprot:XP_005713386.1 enolase [Chondrus crispus]
MVPSGASTGAYEAHELRDGDKKMFNGKGVLKAINNVNNQIAVAVIGMDPTDQEGIDQALNDLDGQPDKSRLGANAILGVSMAVTRAGAAKKGIPLYKHINNLAGNPPPMLPVPCFNVLNGGSHAGNDLAMQEFMVLPTGAETFKEAMQIGVEIYHKLKTVIQKKYGKSSTAVGDEGGFAPNIKDSEEALELIQTAVSEAGYKDVVQIGMDVAASEFYHKDTGKYNLNFKGSPRAANFKTADELLRMYKLFAANYGVISIEDPFDQDDFKSYEKMTGELNELIQIVGDDLLVTNPERIERAIETSACNGLLLKVNQIGTVTEAIEANNLSRNAGFGVMVSHRSGETEDAFIAALCAGLGTGQIKAGAPCRSERLAKYNELLRIEEEMGDQAVFAGEYWRDPWMLQDSSKGTSNW